MACLIHTCITSCISLVFVNNLLGQVKEFGRIHEPTSLVYPPARHAPLHKANAVHLLAFMALIGRSDIRPSDPQGMASTRLKSTNDPLSRSDDDDLTVYGLNSGQNNIIFNSSMQSLDVYEGKGPRQKLDHPRGIACNSDGDVYISDTGHHRIVRLHNPGTYLTFVDAYGREGNAKGQFKQPSGIALGPDGRLYVCDTGNNRLQVFGSKFSHLYSIGDRTDSTWTTTQFFEPYAIAVSSASDSDAYFKEDFLVVVDLDNSRIQKLTLDGQFITGVTSSDYGFQRTYLSSIALDHYNNIWVTDFLNHCIHKFDKNLTYITSFGRIGEDDGEFFEPRSITIGKKFGQVFIADKYSAQYYHIGTDVLNFDVSRQDSSIRFDFFLTEYSRVNARVISSEGATIAKLCQNKELSHGFHTLLWDRRRQSFRSGSLQGRRSQTDSLTPAGDSTLVQEFVPAGLYKIVLEARTTYGYSRYFTKNIEVEFAF